MAIEVKRFPLPDLKGASMTVTGQHGETVVTSAPSYDIPRILELSIDRDRRRLEIKFIYSDSEGSTAQRVDKDLTVFVGLNSGKVLGFLVENFTGAPGHVVVGLVKAIDDRQPARENQRLNFLTVRNLVSTRMEELLAGR